MSAPMRKTFDDLVFERLATKTEETDSKMPAPTAAEVDSLFSDPIMPDTIQFGSFDYDMSYQKSSGASHVEAIDLVSEDSPILAPKTPDNTGVLSNSAGAQMPLHETDALSDGT